MSVEKVEVKTQIWPRVKPARVKLKDFSSPFQFLEAGSPFDPLVQCICRVQGYWIKKGPCPLTSWISKNPGMNKKEVILHLLNAQRQLDGLFAGAFTEKKSVSFHDGSFNGNIYPSVWFLNC